MKIEYGPDKYEVLCRTGYLYLTAQNPSEISVLERIASGTGREVEQLEVARGDWRSQLIVSVPELIALADSALSVASCKNS